MDHIVDNNGRKFISFCQNADVHIVNGRVGNNKCEGVVICTSA